ncbi:MAG: hypothetical protein Q9197_004886 [Variospora fuerteventurae]
MSAAPSRWLFRQAHSLGHRSGQRYASTTSEVANAASSTATKAKDGASNVTSKASQGLSRVTSSAGPALSGAAQGVSNAIGRVGGRTGRLISFVEFEGVQNIPSAANVRPTEKILAACKHEEKIVTNGAKRRRPSETGSLDQLFSQAPSVRSDLSDPAYLSRFDNATASSPQTKQLQRLATSEDSVDRYRWRRRLKQNKTKVMLLGPGLHSGEERRKRHRRLSGRNEEPNSLMKKDHTQLTSRPLESFSHLTTDYDVSTRLGVSLDAQGYRVPTEVQTGTIPLLVGTDYDRGLRQDNRDGRRTEVDLVTVAPTGSGKTLAFLIHILHGLHQYRRQQKTRVGPKTEPGLIQAVILAPTHELVDQIVNEGRKLAIGTGIGILRMRKGLNLGSDDINQYESCQEDMPEMLAASHADNPQSSTAVIKTNILVSTPMLLLHATAQDPRRKTTPLSNVRYLVMDEADVLLDPLFRTQTLDIWNQCTSASLQTSLWSATIGSSVEDLAWNFILDRRRRLGLTAGWPNHHIIRLVVGLKDSALPSLSHRLVYASTERGKLMALRQMIHPTCSTSNEPALQPPFLVFTQTIPRAVALHSELLYEVPLEAGGSSRIAVLHSDLSDNARSAIMTAFRRGEIWILITTDLLARGIDFRGLNGVVNYDIPNTSGIYIHRVGRTGRQGREGGVAVTLYTKEDIKYVKNVANVIAASEKQRGKLSGIQRGHGLEEWLLNALPDVSKKTKKDLKKRGVDARRTTLKGKDSDKEVRRMRISTKSGYDRALDQKKRQAVATPKHGSAKEWNGIED